MIMNFLCGGINIMCENNKGKEDFSRTYEIFTRGGNVKNAPKPSDVNENVNKATKKDK